MAYPPTIPLGNVDNTTPQVDRHPADHNAITNALRDLVNELGTNPKGDSTTVTARLASMAPVGSIVMFGGLAAPAGWFLCAGQAVSRSLYPELFALFGTTYGVGDGSTTFNLPDLRSRFPVGKGTAGFSDALGEAGGSKDAVVVSHNHSQNAHNHSQNAHDHSIFPTRSTADQGGGDANLYSQTNNPGISGYGPNNAYAQSIGGTAATNNAATASNNAAGVSGADANLPPYITLNFIVRAVV